MAENILHFGGIRFRVNGSGQLKLSWIGLDDVQTETLKPIALKALPGNQPLRLSNFKGTRARFRLSVDGMNQYFIVNRTVVYMKEMWTSLPQ